MQAGPVALLYTLTAKGTEGACLTAFSMGPWHNLGTVTAPPAQNKHPDQKRGHSQTRGSESCAGPPVIQVVEPRGWALSLLA